MKPADFFVGAMDFFAIVMPGALLVFLLLPLNPYVFGPLLPSLSDTALKWAAFAVGSYVFGHLLHHVGSVLDGWYDEGFARDKRRFGAERLLQESRKLVQDDLGKDLEDISTFEWAGSWVRAHNAAAAAELERAGGDSKFFRSLCIVAAIAVIVFLAKGSGLAALASLALALFSYRRFCKRRWDATQRTYEYFVMLRREAAAAIGPDATASGPKRKVLSDDGSQPSGLPTRDEPTTA